MKNALLVVFLATSVLFGGLYVRELQQAARSQAIAERAERDAKDAAVRAAATEKRLKELASRLARAEAEAANSAIRAAQAERPAAAPASPSAPPPPAAPQPDSAKKKGLALFGEMFNDPEMREMMRSQQKAFRGTMVDMTYGSLLKQLNLTPENADKLKELLKGKLGVATDMGMNFLAPDMTPEKRKELTDKMKEQTDGYNAQIRQLLGDQDYQRLEFHEGSLAERRTMDSFKQQLPSSAAMSPAQEEALTRAMFEQRKDFKFTFDFNDQRQLPTENVAEMLTDERLNQFAKEQERLDQLNLIKARQILRAEQLGPFEEHLKNQREMQQNMMKLGAKMFRGFGGGKQP